MDRLCERPGCSEPASVAYGMRPEDLVFWLDVLITGDDEGRGVLCRRHADTMVVPRGWTLDDQREPDLRLFRPPPMPPAPPASAGRPPRRRRPAVAAVTTAEQLPLDEPASGEPSTDPVAPPWSPSFDDADDLDGLLSANSPLLARAFGGTDRRRRT